MELGLIQSIDLIHRLNLQPLVQEHRDVLPESLPKGRPKKWDVEHAIKVEPPSSKPPNRPPYRLGLVEEEELEIQNKDLLAQEFISPKFSLYRVPILLYLKGRQVEYVRRFLRI